MRRSTLAGTLVVVLSLLAATTACGGERGGQTTACRLTAVIRPQMTEAGVTFRDLVVGDPDISFVRGMTTGLALLSVRTRNVENEYLPVIDFLVDRNIAANRRRHGSGKVPIPQPTEAVVASAERLDESIRQGACG
jgi:hypothetical protein